MMTGDGYTIEDLGSTNGTWVNERRTSGPHQLSNGESVRLGDNITLVYEMVGFDPDATIASTGAAAPPPPVRQAPPPQQQYQQPAPPPTPPAQQHYGGQVPAPPAASKKSNRGLWIALGVLGLMAVCMAIFLWYVDANCLWCEITWNLLPGCPYTGTCP